MEPAAHLFVGWEQPQLLITFTLALVFTAVIYLNIKMLVGISNIASKTQLPL